MWYNVSTEFCKSNNGSHEGAVNFSSDYEFCTSIVEYIIAHGAK